jgi:hypothetical protein
MLGTVDKPDPEPDATKQDEPKKTARGLIVSGSNAALLLEMPDEALDA